MCFLCAQQCFLWIRNIYSYCHWCWPSCTIWYKIKLYRKKTRYKPEEAPIQIHLQGNFIIWIISKPFCFQWACCITCSKRRTVHLWDILVDVGVQPVMDHYVPSPVVAGKRCGVPPILQHKMFSFQLHNDMFFSVSLHTKYQYMALESLVIRRKF